MLINAITNFLIILFIISLIALVIGLITKKKIVVYISLTLLILSPIVFIGLFFYAISLHTS